MNVLETKNIKKSISLKFPAFNTKITKKTIFTSPKLLATKMTDVKKDLSEIFQESDCTENSIKYLDNQNSGNLMSKNIFHQKKPDQIAEKFTEYNLGPSF